MDGSLILVNGGHIGTCVDVVLHDGWIQPRNFSVRLGKYVVEFLEFLENMSWNFSVRTGKYDVVLHDGWIQVTHF